MSQWILFITACFLVLAPLGPAAAQQSPRRGMYVSVIQQPETLSSRQAIKDLISYSRKARIEALFIQVYRANQSWFPTPMADQTPYTACFQAVGEDAFALLITEAHTAGIEVHAWVNLLSLSKNKNAPILKKYGPSILTKNLKDKQKIEDYRIDNQYFLEPGDPRVRAELLIMVGDLLRTYPKLDGIQFDYIRYPDKDPHYGFTRANVDRYREVHGPGRIEEKSAAWQDWKREQVTELLTQLTQRSRLLRPDLQVSTTGCAPFVRALDEAFQDWPSWVNRGLVDFVTVMTYDPDPKKYARLVADVLKRVKDPQKLNITIGPYQLLKAAVDFQRELGTCQKDDHRSCVVFHYGNLLEAPALGDILAQ